MPDNDNIDNIDPVNADDNTNPVNTDPTPNPDDINTSDDIIIYNDTPIYDDVDPLFPKTIESERDRAKAEELFNKGLDLYNKKKYDEAKESYLEALDYDDTYSLLYLYLGFLYSSKSDYETKSRYYEKYLEYEPLDKSVVDILEITLRNDLKRPDDADKVLRNYNTALQDHINDNTKGRKELSTKVTKIESRLDDTKLEEYVKETEDTLTHIKESESKIDSIEAYINNRYKELHPKLTGVETGSLAEYYQKKANDLREDLRGVPKKLFNKIPCPSLGFIQKYWGMILIDIAVLLGFYSLTSIDVSIIPLEIKMKALPTNAWEILSPLVLTSPIMILLLWGTRYFNRRIHETVHLIEEYEHKAIVLKSFPSYSAQLKSLDTSTEKTALLKYTEKVSHIITESPTHALTRKKTDKLPMEFVQALNQAHSKN